MFIMLIFNGVLLLAVARYGTSENSLVGARSRRDSIKPTGPIIWSTPTNDSEGKQYISPYSSLSVSDVLPAATTVHTVPSDPTTGSNYNSYHRKGGNAVPAEQHYRKKAGQPNLQGGFQPGKAPQSPNRHIDPQGANNQYQTKVPIKGPGKSQYFSNPSSYRFISEPAKSQLRSGPFPRPGAFPTFPKFKSSSKFPTITSGDHSFENPSKYRFNSGPAFNPQSIYKSNFQSVPKNIGGSPVSLESSSNVSGFVKALETEPVLLTTGLDYQAHPTSSGLSYDYPKSHSASLINRPQDFSPNLASYQPRLVSVHSPKSTAQIPQYQAASVNGFAEDRNRPSAVYEQLANQPQLHFTTGAPGQSAGTFQPIYHSNPLEKIRTDVELIDKKSTTTASPFDSDENDFDQAFKTNVRDFPYSSTDIGSSEPLKSLTRDNSFELPRSNLFNSYDQAFGKYSKLASLEQDSSPKFVPSSTPVTSKPTYEAAKEDDEVDDEDKSSGEYRSNYEDKDSAESYEDEDEGESRRSERQGSYEDKRNEDDEDDAPASYRSYGQDFEKEFEDSYRKDLPKSDYVHVKEVPEIEESETKEGRPATKISRLATRQNTRHGTRGNHERTKKYPDSESHASGTFFRSAKTGVPPFEESFGHKIPHDRGTKRYAKKDSDESTKGKISVEDLSAESSTFGTEPTSTLTPIANLQSYSFPAFDDWKPTTRLTTDTDSYAPAKQESRAFLHSDDTPEGFFRGQPAGLTSNGQIVRDLRGI